MAPVSSSHWLRNRELTTTPVSVPVRNARKRLGLLSERPLRCEQGRQGEGLLRCLGVKAVAMESEVDLRWVPGTHVVEGENGLEKDDL